jgi:hypothetical protein
MYSKDKIIIVCIIIVIISVLLFIYFGNMYRLDYENYLIEINKNKTIFEIPKQ